MGVSIQPQGMPVPQAQPPMPPGIPVYNPAQATPAAPVSTGVQYGLESLPPTQAQQAAAQQPQGQQPAQSQGQPPIQPTAVPQGTIPVSAQTVLDGPDLPPELRGRSLGEITQIYQGLRNLQLSRTAPAPIPQPAPVPQAPIPAAVPGSNGQPANTRWDWSNPQASVEAAVRGSVEEILQRTLMPMLAPMVQNNHQQAVMAARDMIAREIGPQRWAQIEGTVLQRLNGIQDPRAFTTPELWRTAAHAVLGEAVARGQIAPTAQPAPTGYTPAGPVPVQVVGQPIPNINAFFAEGPNAHAGVGGSLSPEQMDAAKAMGMTNDQYIAWQGGIQPVRR